MDIKQQIKDAMRAANRAFPGSLYNTIGDCEASYVADLFDRLIQSHMESHKEAPQDKLHPSIEMALNEMVKASQNKKPMTKREVFAMAAMQGLLSNAPFVQTIGHSNMDHKQIVTISIGIADELLKQLEKCAN